MTYKLKLTAQGRSRRAAIEFARSVLGRFDTEAFENQKYVEVILPWGNACVELAVTRTEKRAKD